MHGRETVNKTCNAKMRSQCMVPICPILLSQKPGDHSTDVQRGCARARAEQLMVGNHLIQANLSTVIQLRVCILLPTVSGASWHNQTFSTAQVCTPCLSLQGNAEETDDVNLLSAKAPK